jgi:hypothetical protein
VWRVCVRPHDYLCSALASDAGTGATLHRAQSLFLLTVACSAAAARTRVKARCSVAPAQRQAEAVWLSVRNKLTHQGAALTSGAAQEHLGTTEVTLFLLNVAQPHECSSATFNNKRVTSVVPRCSCAASS